MKQLRFPWLAFAMMIPFLMPGLARSGETLTLLVRSRELSPDRLRELQAAIESRLNQSSGVLALVPEESAGREQVEAAPQRATALLTQAWESYRKFDYPQALLRLQQSQAALPKGCGGADLALLVSQQLLKGLIHFTAGRREEARASFEQLSALDPAWAPDAKELAPKIVAAFEEARQHGSGRPRALLRLDGKPLGATVWLDGRQVGVLPTVIEELPAGIHCLQVTSAGHGIWIRPLTVPEGSKLQLRAVLLPELARGVLDPAAAVDLGEVARAFATDFLVLVDAGPSEVLSQVTAAGSGKIAKPISCAAADASSASAALVSCIQAGILNACRELSAPPPLLTTENLGTKVAGGAIAGLSNSASRPVAPPAPAEPVWFRRFWFWTLVGGVVLVGAGVSLALLLDPGQRQTGYRAVVTAPGR